MLWVSLESLLFDAFAKNTSRIGRRGHGAGRSFQPRGVVRKPALQALLHAQITETSLWRLSTLSQSHDEHSMIDPTAYGPVLWR